MPPGTATATGPVLAAGVRLALTDHLLLGVTARRLFVGALQLTAAPGEIPDTQVLPIVPVDGIWFGVTLGWRFGGGAG